MNAIRNLFRHSAALVKRHPAYAGIGAAVIIGGIVIALTHSQNETSGSEPASPRAVETIAVAEYRSGGALHAAYPTASGDAFAVRAENTGRITYAAKSGAKVAAGAVIARFDSASQAAALTQAQGSYEAAQAAAARSNIGVADAETALQAAKQAAVNADRAALASWSAVLFNTADQVFANPRVEWPTLLITGSGDARALSTERHELSKVLPAWQEDVDGLSAAANTAGLNAALDRAIAHVDRLAALVNTLTLVVAKQDPGGTFDAAALARMQGDFSGAQATLNASRASLESAKNGLKQAEEALASARIGGTGPEISAASASLKQALGSLQAVRANYDKTIVRAPFAGTITAMNVAAGDIVNFGADVAIIAPAEGEETESSFLLPLSAVKYTPAGALVFLVNSENRLEAKSVETGLVTAAAIEVTGLSGDERIVADVRGLKAGERVAVE